MTARRKPITVKMKLASLLYHNDIECPLCGVFLKSTDEIQWDHRHPVALGGEHDCTNIEACHVACHRKKTFGAGATTAGSDIGNISKARRLEKRRLGTEKPKLKKAWPSKPIPSRPFPKRKKA